jgi:cobalt/nickel transport system permease protein
MINIDKYAYSSALKKKDPMEKLTFALTTLGVCLWAGSIPISITVLIIMTTATVKKGQTPFKFYLKLMLIPITFLIVGVVTIAVEISVSRESFIAALFIFDRYIGVSKTSLVTAAVIFFKALGSVACLYYLSLNTPMVALLSALRKMRCPKLIVELMSLIYRFIFVLMETAETMLTAQTSRLGYARLSSGYRSMGMLLSTLFIRAYKKSDELYTSLEARGYEGELNVLEESYERSFRSYLTIAGINIFLIIGTLLIKHYIGGQY